MDNVLHMYTRTWSSDEGNPRRPSNFLTCWLAQGQTYELNRPKAVSPSHGNLPKVAHVEFPSKAIINTVTWTMCYTRTWSSDEGNPRRPSNFLTCWLAQGQTYELNRPKAVSPSHGNLPKVAHVEYSSKAIINTVSWTMCYTCTWSSDERNPRRPWYTNLQHGHVRNLLKVMPWLLDTQTIGLTQSTRCWEKYIHFYLDHLMAHQHK